MAYLPLGARATLAAPDTTGTNPGFYTAVFTAAKLGIHLAAVELYRAVVETAHRGTEVAVQIGNYRTSIGPVGTRAEWDPTNPPLIQGQQDVYFMFSQKESKTPAPRVTIWLRYDSALKEQP